MKYQNQKRNFLFSASGLAILASPQAAQAQGQGPSPGQGFGMFLPLIIIFVIFYLLIVRPQQKQAKQRQQMIKELKKGDQVVTVGGILGKIIGVADDILTVELADNVKIKMERSGIQALRGGEAQPEKK